MAAIESVFSPWALPILADGLLLLLIQSSSARERVRASLRIAPALLDMLLFAFLAGLVLGALDRTQAVQPVSTAVSAAMLSDLRLALASIGASPIAGALPGLATIALGIVLTIRGLEEPAGLTPSMIQPVERQAFQPRPCACGCGRLLPSNATARRLYLDGRCRRTAARARRRSSAPRRSQVAA